jgi:signal peptidase II
MYLGQEFLLANWAIIHFTENNGMAFGMELGGMAGKIALTVFRICFVLGFAWYLKKLVQENADRFYIICLSMIIAGASGNIIDSIFYGKLFGGSDFQVAEFLPSGGGYAPFLQGKVVDMFYFPILKGNFPEWFPIWSGEEFIFFRPVFNVADASISVGVILMLLFQKRFFGHHEKEVDDDGGYQPSASTNQINNEA